MESFARIRFKGQFRSYQQKVLDDAVKYLEDRKLHIVAAPGSGKTVLGLELIRCIGSPVLILSPSVTIRQQWGERFKELFLPDGEVLENFMSFSLKEPRLLTSITYQSLHAAWSRQTLNIDDDGESGIQEIEDYDAFDLIGCIRKAGIKSICLDEAHHLRSEWQKSLHAFIHAIERSVTVVSLTATPPYDSGPLEWKRYIAMCGEIDEEISVPELVREGTLCPHQDYVFLSWPDDSERMIIMDHRERVSEAMAQVLHDKRFDELLSDNGFLTAYHERCERILDERDGYLALAILAQFKGIPVPKKLSIMLTGRNRLPGFKVSWAEKAFQFILDHPDHFSSGLVEWLCRILSRGRLIKRKKVSLVSDETLRKTLVSSTGKLSSIARIAQEEYKAMGDALRMLVLTDHIKHDMIDCVGTTMPVTQMGSVPVFEVIRRSVGEQAGLVLLTGSLVICPLSICSSLGAIASRYDVPFNFKQLAKTGFAIVHFGVSNKGKVTVITEAFRRGLFHILVGTKSLLGEGWDSPCINSLILASFIGSFVSSNQMRGRAIRVDAAQPDKTANIWHLATLEPPIALKQLSPSQGKKRHDMEQESAGDDFDMLKRRFECFLAPAYSTDLITNGIERVDIIHPPYDERHVEQINERMLGLAADRTRMALRWTSSLDGIDYPEIALSDRISRDIVPTGAYLYYVLSGVVCTLLYLCALYGIHVILMVYVGLGGESKLVEYGLMGIFFLIWLFGFLGLVLKLQMYLSPYKWIRALALAVKDSLVELGEIKTANPRVVISSEEQDTVIGCYLEGANIHEKNLFSNCIRELVSPIDNPRYVLVRKERYFFWTRFNERQSFACPSLLGSNKRHAEIFKRHLNYRLDRFDMFYTRNLAGNRMLLKCRRWSWMNRNARYLERLEEVI